MPTSPGLVLRAALVVGAATACLALGLSPAARAAEPAAPQAATRSEPARRAADLLGFSAQARGDAVEWFRRRGEPDAIPALVLALRFIRNGQNEFYDALTALAGENPGDDWAAWMRWIEAHPEIAAFEDFDAYQADVFAGIDESFRLFLGPGVAHAIRLEEIVWGNVQKDGIPALTNPAQIPAGQARYLRDDDLVFGVAINGDIRAYPLRIMDWHEMFNDVIGGVPVSLAYCTLCASGVLYETRIDGRDAPFVFGSSGLLYRSNKLMYDAETHSLWNQFTGRPVVGPLTGSGITLETRPVTVTTWARWRAANPETTVLSPDTGFERDYTPGRPYGRYFASPDLLYPALVSDEQLEAKDFVFALRGQSAQRAWPLSRFEGGAVINDLAGAVPVTLIGDAATRTVRAYRTDGRLFERAATPDHVVSGDAPWRVREDALMGPDGLLFRRLPGHVAYWFAWSGFLGGEGDLAVE